MTGLPQSNIIDLASCRAAFVLAGTGATPNRAACSNWDVFERFYHLMDSPGYPLNSPRGHDLWRHAAASLSDYLDREFTALEMPSLKCAKRLVEQGALTVLIGREIELSGEADRLEERIIGAPTFRCVETYAEAIGNFHEKMGRGLALPPPETRALVPYTGAP